MEILLGHVVHSAGLDTWYESIAGAAGAELEVRCFNVTLNPPGPRLSWNELDDRWKKRDKTLLKMYERLQQAASECDVFLLYNGANIHPEFLNYLPTFNVYCCFDDPESSEDLSGPVAAGFDAVFYGNIASRFQYENWGCKKLAWLPIFTSPRDLPTEADAEKLLAGERNIDISIVCERNQWRQKRLDMLAGAFPQAKCYGNGWPAGRIEASQLHELYSRTRIGWNVHNSTGPINRRLFMLPAFGVLQICDNKTGLGKIFELGKEVVGFDTIPEAVEATQYYLAHEAERREIAERGFRRYWRDYHSGAIWNRIKSQLEEWGASKKVPCSGHAGPLPRKDVSAILSSFAVAARRKASVFLNAGDPALEPSAGVSSHLPDERAYLGEPVPAYNENREMRGVNMAKERLSRGEPFEWPNMVALNWAVTALIGKAKKIVEIGSGTGPFADLAATDLSRTIQCFEEDDFARTWAEQTRSHPNVTYFKRYDGNISQHYDLLVSMDVIEHVSDVRAFLLFCCRLAPRAIFTSPNRLVVRRPGDIGPPDYQPHVREFAAGEMYWVLKQYYRDVALYYMPDVYVPWLEPMTVATQGTPIIAECTGSLSE